MNNACVIGMQDMFTYVCVGVGIYIRMQIVVLSRYCKFRQYLNIILAVIQIEHAIGCSGRLFVVACTFQPEWLVADRISRWSIFRVRYRFFFYASDLFDMYIMTHYHHHYYHHGLFYYVVNTAFPPSYVK